MKIEPCPLCGDPAEGFYDGDYYADYEFSIRCTNMDCGILLPANGDVLKGGAVTIDREDIAKWNNRVKQPVKLES